MGKENDSLRGLIISTLAPSLAELADHSSAHDGKAMRGQTEDEGGRCPFLLENDDSKIVICMCNYYSLGQVQYLGSDGVGKIDYRS